MMHGLLRALRAEWALGRESLALLKAALGRKQDASAAYELEALHLGQQARQVPLPLVSVLSRVAQHTQVVATVDLAFRRISRTSRILTAPLAGAL
jgi:hypothetical protein